MSALAYKPSGQKLFYFTGKVRAFWKDKVFFMDQKNAAVIDFGNLYVNGAKASQIDLHRLDAKVAGSDWDSAPVFHSYVTHYTANDDPPWPYKLKGKKLWFAKFAWMGIMPEALEKRIMKENVEALPITYYSGKIIDLFEDKILYGDYRNNVFANLTDVCVYGVRATDQDAYAHLYYEAPVLHSFIVSPQYLMSKNYNGPEPSMPSCHIDNYGQSIWLAKFAWLGEMPEEFKLQLPRFHVIKITEWDFFGQKAGNVPRPISLSGGHAHQSKFCVASSAKGKGGKGFVSEPLIVTTQKEAAIIKGSLLLANHQYGLMNSYLDVIIFSTKNLYVNGEAFRDDTALDDFFYEKKYPLTAWIVPLKEPILVFDVYVVWRAVCVWYGVPPKNMEAIKNRYDTGSISGSIPKTLNTKSDQRYTLVMGEITSVTYHMGTAVAKVGEKLLNITFKRKALYMKGCKLHSKCTLTEIEAQLIPGVWTFLIYPFAENGTEIVYSALAVWQYHYQHLVSTDMLYRILLEGGSIPPESSHKVESNDTPAEDQMGRHMTGIIVATFSDYGILETKSVTIEPAYVFFSRHHLYVDGVVPDVKQLKKIDCSRQVNLYARSCKQYEIRNYAVTMYASLVWMGKKPLPSEYSSDVVENSQSSATVSSGANGHLEDHSNRPSIPENESPDARPKDDSSQSSKSGATLLEHKTGLFVLLKDRYGIIRTGNNASSPEYVLFDFSIMWIQGKRLESDNSLSDALVSDKVHCNFLAYTIPRVEVSGHWVTMQASSVWMGRKPLHIELPVSKSPLKALEAVAELLKSQLDWEPMTKSAGDYVLTLENGKRPICSSKDVSAISSGLAKMNLNVSAKGKGDPGSKPKIEINPDNPYAGKHVKARVVKLMNDQGIAMWNCATLKGEVFIMFNKKDVFVNLCPLDLDQQGSSLVGKPCNFYAIPTTHVEREGFKVSLQATCGWMGTKPINIPAIGEQDHAQISLDDAFAVNVKVGKNVSAFIVKLFKDTGIAKWRSVMHGGDIYIEFEKSKSNDTLQACFQKPLDPEIKTRMCYFYVVPMERKQIEGHTVSLSAFCGWMGKKPLSFPKQSGVFQPTLLSEKLHVTPVSSTQPNQSGASTSKQAPSNASSAQNKQETINSLDVVKVVDSPSTSGLQASASGLQASASGLQASASGLQASTSGLQASTRKKNAAAVWEEEEVETPYLEGKIVELHSNVGRLEGSDEKNYFFARENSFLYGVNLANVELWHVLVQDEKVSYRLTEMTAGQVKVKKMWIGSEKLEVEKAAAHIYEWCGKHAVPEGAKELLIAQLEVDTNTPIVDKETPIKAL